MAAKENESSLPEVFDERLLGNAGHAATFEGWKDSEAGKEHLKAEKDREDAEAKAEEAQVNVDEEDEKPKSKSTPKAKEDASA